MLLKKLLSPVVAGMLAFGGLANAMTLEDVVFHHTFEKGLDATMARGGSEPMEIIGTPEIVAGPDGGKAVKLRHGLDAIGFEIDGNLNPEHGAISFWLSSGGNWDGSMPNLLQILFHTDEGESGNQLVLQTIWHHRGLSLIAYDRNGIIGGFPTGVQAPRAPLWLAEDAASVLQEDEWYHYLYTWRDGHIVVYQNGVEMAHFEHPGLRFRDLGERFYLGWKKDPDAEVTDMNRGELFFDPMTHDRALPDADTSWESLLADITVFRSYIFPHQAARIYEEGAMEYARGAEPSPMEMTATYYQTPGRCVVNVISPSASAAEGELRVVDSQGEVVHKEHFKVPGDEVESVVTLELSELPIGEYEVYAVVDETGFETSRVGFEKVQPEWLGNMLGAEDVVLEPWTPVEVAPLDDGGYRVSVWGRDYMMHGALPASILSQNEELLSSPVALVLDDGSGEESVNWSKPEVVEATETRVVLSSTGEAAGYEIEATTRIEFDGMLWTELDFRSPEGIELTTMRLDAPIAKPYCVFAQHAILRDNWFPKEESLFASFDRTPYLYVGNDDAGLQWFAESDQWWYAEDPGRALEIAPTEDGGEIRVHMVRDAIKMPEEFSISFGLMAAPVRPRPEGWRGWGGQSKFRRGKPEKFNNVLPAYAWTQTAPGWLFRRAPASGEDMLLDSKPSMDRRPGMLPFSSTHFLGMRHYNEPELRQFLPEWRQFSPEWLDVPSRVEIRSKPGWNHAYVIPSSSYIDFYCWQLEHMLTNTDERGVYQDGYAGKGGRSANLEAGFGYIDRDGTIKGTHPILAGRELYRRSAAILQRHRGEQGALMVHHATSLILPVLSFANTIYDGEFTGWGDIQEAAKEGGIPAGHTEDRMRCVLSMSAFGHVPYVDSRNFFRWIEWDIDARFGGQRPHGYELSARDMMARYLLIDVHAFFHHFALDWVRHITDWWGIADPEVEFLPYWAENPAATINNGGLIGGFINRSDGRVLLITAGGRGGSPYRFLREGRNGCEIELDLKQLGLKPGKFRVTDAESFGTLELPVTDNQISLTKEAMEVCFIAIEPTE